MNQKKLTGSAPKLIYYSQRVGLALFRILFKAIGKQTLGSLPEFSQDKTYFFIANHQSRMDPFASFSVLPQAVVKRIIPIRFMTASSLFYSFLYPVLKLLGCYPTRKKNVDVIERTATYLNTGYCVYMFPEGKRVLRTESGPRSGVERILAQLDPNVRPVLVHIEWTRKRRLRQDVRISFRELVLEDIKGLSAKDIMHKVYEV